MCGIVGVINGSHAAGLLTEALRRVDYRGYDNAGVATVVDGRIERRRVEGKIDALASLLENEPLAGKTGIGHTRWRTHGNADVANAHPHISTWVDGKQTTVVHVVGVVHNGIIENWQELRAEVVAHGAHIESQTDTEVIAHLVAMYRARGLSWEHAAVTAIRRLMGQNAVLILFADNENLLVGSSNGLPMAIGYGGDSMYVGSDANALAHLTDKVQYLRKGDIAFVSRHKVIIQDVDGRILDNKKRPVQTIDVESLLAEKGPWPTFMAKEIHEQPKVVGDTLRAFDDLGNFFPSAVTQAIQFVFAACGTSYYAGSVAKIWMETVARIPARADLASELAYLEPPIDPRAVGVLISQSGETAEILLAQRFFRSIEVPVLPVVNVSGSTLARESDIPSLRTLAGPEIAVASTKAFLTQLVTLLQLTLSVAAARGRLNGDELASIAFAVRKLPTEIMAALEQEQKIKKIAEVVANARTVLFIARGLLEPIAREGALKLMEISYIPALGYAAGELKHGPIAVVDDGVPVIVLAPSTQPLFYQKTISNLAEVQSRNGKIILVSDRKGIEDAGGLAHFTIELPEIDPVTAPIPYTVPLQLLALHVAAFLGRDVDKPRNLAKSVTVE